MTFPDAWARRRVTAHYQLRDGTSATGSVRFSSPQIVLLDGTIILPVDVVAALDGSGAIDVLLPCTNDPAISPTGWTWLVEERIAGAGRRFYMAVDIGGGDIDLATVAPVVPIAAMGALSTYNLVIGTVTTLPAGSEATAAIRGEIPNQVLDIGIPISPDTGAGGSALPPGGNPGDVVTRTAGGAAWQPPSLNWNSTNW